MIPYDFHPDAAEELQTAIDYYNAQRKGLGREFLGEVAHVISLIRTWPNAGPSISPRSRRCRTRRFPYGLVYQVREGRICILAVMDLRRKPGYWQEREDN